MSRFVSPVFNITDSNGAPMVGAKLVFYATGTETLKTVYSDADLTTPITNPVTAVSSDAGAIYPDIYLDGVYKVVQQDDSGTADTDDGAVMWTRDPVGDVVTGNFSAWLSDSSYDEPEVVYASDNNYYYSLVDANQGNEPSSSPSEWQLIPMKDMASTENDTFNSPALNTPTIEDPVINGDVTGDSGVSRMILGTPIATTFGTEHVFTGIPTWAKKITVMLDSVSTDGVLGMRIQIGDSGGIDATGYKSASSIVTSVSFDSVSSTSSFFINTSSASDSGSGSLVLSLMDSSLNTWVISGVLINNISGTIHSSGVKALANTLDRVQLSSSDTFDAGSVNIIYEG